MHYHLLPMSAVAKTWTIERQTLLLLKSTTYSQNNNYVIQWYVIYRIRMQCIDENAYRSNTFVAINNSVVNIYQMSDDQIAK